MQVRQLILTATAFVIAGAGPAHAQSTAPDAGDSGLQSLVAEALARKPTVALRRSPPKELDRGPIRQTWNHVLRPDIYSPP